MSESTDAVRQTLAERISVLEAENRRLRAARPAIGTRYRDEGGKVVAVVAPAVLGDAMMYSAAGYDQRTMRATWHGLYDAMLAALPEP